MKSRKAKEIAKVLLKKGFRLDPSKQHHDFYYLIINGKKQGVYTYLSHGSKDYGNSLMQMIKKQLKFRDNQLAEDFFDCPMSITGYIEMLTKNGDL